MGEKENIIDKVLTYESVHRVICKAEKLDLIMEKAGKEPVMRKAVNKTILPFHIDRHQAWKLERCFDAILNGVDVGRKKKQSVG